MWNNRSEPETGEEIELREQMVREQLMARGIDDPLVLRAFRSVPRSWFCDSRTSLAEAYADHAMAIGRGQTISQPYMVALMTSLLRLASHEKVLEVGTGSGYQAAILSQIAGQLHTVELIPELAERAGTKLQRLAADNVSIHVGDGSLGWPGQAPYDAMLITAAAPEIPSPLIRQLADGGRLVAPVGDRVRQVLKVVRRDGDRLVSRDESPCVFVPLLGQHGWSQE